ncbi:hypothetical protein EDC65_2282 [Stella humosa]|uniref:Uncharacterized protein n=1 Tax=Stella humosa TaxID=94 RepID=A0A3N1M9W9_9PROT|nr:hypothetical protein [Stella humosa]ROQ00483.1 hypothetical protein EDC65_2282 [Stella humosa]BBK30272.1 hypothetical protein STHU_09060 [Stella humosa]
MAAAPAGKGAAARPSPPFVPVTTTIPVDLVVEVRDDGGHQATLRVGSRLLTHLVDDVPRDPETLGRIVRWWFEHPEIVDFNARDCRRAAGVGR